MIVARYSIRIHCSNVQQEQLFRQLIYNTWQNTKLNLGTCGPTQCAREKPQLRKKTQKCNSLLQLNAINIKVAYIHTHKDNTMATNTTAV